MIEVSKAEAEKIATQHVGGTRYRCGSFEGTVRAVSFGDQRSEFKLETTRLCDDGVSEPRAFKATFGIAIDDLRGWCADRHGCRKGDIVLWFD